MATDREIQKLKDQVEDLKNQLEKIALDTLGPDQEEKRRILEGVKQKTKQTWDKTKSSAFDAKNYIEENPWKAIGAAAVIGFIAGIIMTKKK